MNDDERILLRCFESRIKDSQELRSCIVHASVYGEILILLCGCNTEIPVVERMIRDHWDGEIEVLRLWDLVVGSKSQNDDVFIFITSRTLH